MKEEESVWLLCINDFHAEIFATNNTPGCAKLVTAVKEFKRFHPNTTVLFGGDNYKGDPVSEICDGEPVSHMMRQLNTAASAVGNHEFDFGISAINQWQAEGKYCFVAANIVEKNSDKTPFFVEPYIMLKHAGLRIAVLGLALEEALETADRPSEMADYEVTNSFAAAKKWVEHIKAKEAPNAIVALTHLPSYISSASGTLEGEAVLKICNASLGLNGVFTAHFHQHISKRANGVAVVQAGSGGRAIGAIRLDFSQEGKCLHATPEVIELTDRINTLIPDAATSIMVENCRKKAMEKLGNIVAYADIDIVHRNSITNEVPPEGTPLTALATGIMCDKTGCEIALFYAGRMGNGFIKGYVSLYQLHQTFQFNNSLVTMVLSGKAIRKNIETGLRTLQGEHASPIGVGGVRVKANMRAPYGKRLYSAMLLNGAPLCDEVLYRVVVDDYLAESPLGFDFSQASDIVHTGVSLRQCMIDEICDAGVIKSTFEMLIELTKQDCEGEACKLG